MWQPDTQGKIYSDALLAPGIRKQYKELRYACKNNLFCHMSLDVDNGNTIFVKSHYDGHGVSRVIVDYLYFVLGMENQEFNEGLKSIVTAEPLRKKQK